MIKLTKETIYGLSGSCLVQRFDGSLKTPDCHLEWWELCCSPAKYVALAAPRGHAKSTAITLTYSLAELLFRSSNFAVIISDTETQASMFLGAIKQELQENENIVELFGIKKDAEGKVKFYKDSESDFICEFDDGHKFRVIAKGSEQKLRGLLWNGMRPDLIVCHEKDTEIFTPETGWIKNTDYPCAKLIHAHDAWEVEFEDGTKEVVSGDHRYLTEEGWKFPWMMKPNENVVENITDDIMNAILSAEKNKIKTTTILQKLKHVVRNGWRTIWISILLQKNDGKIKIKNTIISKLKNIAKKILASQLNAVPKGEHGS